MVVGGGRALSPLVGREDVSELLRAALVSVTTGNGDCLVIEGPAGIGKSRMLAEAAAQAGELGLTVAEGRATELDRIAPFSTLLTALSVCDPPVLDKDGLAGLRDHADSRFWLIDRLGGVLESYSHARPLVVSLDDVQWADELTALTLRVLVPALRSLPVLWLLARRPFPGRSASQYAFDWLIAEGARRLPLKPLSESAVAELCAQTIGAVPRDSLLELVAGSGGNPFLLESLLTGLREGNRVRIEDGAATVSGTGLPVGFVAAVDQRLRDLSAEARRLLDAVAVFGRPCTLHEIAGLLETQAVRLVDPAQDAVQAGVLVDNGTTLYFQHDLVREAIYGGLTGPARQALHRIAIDVLQNEGRPAPEIAEHLIRGGKPGDARTLAVVRDAVAEVAATAPGAGADLILGALGTSGGRDPERTRLVADAVQLLASAGRLAEARELGESYLRRGLEAPVEAAVLLGLAEALKHAGQDESAISYTRRALELPDIPAGQQAHLLAIQAHAQLQTNDIAGANEAAELAVRLGGEAGEHSAVVFAMEARGVAAYAGGELAAAAGFADAAVRLADTVAGPARHRHPRLWQGMVLTAMDRFDAAADTFAADKIAADELGTAWSRPLWHHLHADLLRVSGRLDDAEAVADAGVRAGQQLGAIAVTPALLATLGQIAIHRDDLPAALDHLRRARHHVHSGIGVISEEFTWELALYEEAVGRPEQAFELLTPLYDGFPDRLYLVVHDRSAGARLVRIALRVGAADRAEAAVEATRVAADLNPDNASLAAAASHAAGLLRGDLELLRAAVAAFREAPRPYDRASAMEDTGVAECAAGQVADGVALLKDALTEYAGIDAKRDVRRVRGRLQALGVRTGGTRGGRRAKTGWASLTESELRVARLVAQGNTNRQIAASLFLSPHTVDSHIRHVFAKLGVSSRVELTRRALSDDQPTSG
ncbi:helix-turn-helix transcriptional regulator [Actinophytocola sp.]|uniref:helix-turn-helix transcriptional regulator n=1 Tax=Actinophytocola sp. TaxID=1872138 RepID=UPI002ED3B144